MYYAIIGDIVESKQLLNRDDVQDKLKNILAEVNKKYLSDIAANFVVTIGDEFQGLLHKPNNLLKIIDYIKVNLYPVMIRLGIGVGDISTKINPIMALGADGPAYHCARRAINNLKENSKKNQKSEKDIELILAEIKHLMLSNLINSLFSAVYSIERKWTAKQREAVGKIYKKQKTQQQVAEMLNITQSSLQRRLSAAEYLTYRDLKESIEMVFLKL